MHRWSVVSGLIEQRGELLLVANRRQGGHVDWSPPGGVVDAGEGPLPALTREVVEETGLAVAGWAGPVYEVRVEFGERRSRLSVSVYRAESWSGDLHVEDPDGIVFDAAFHSPSACRTRLISAPAWVADPLSEWLEHRFRGPRRFAYRALGGRDLATMRVERV